MRDEQQQLLYEFEGFYLDPRRRRLVRKADSAVLNVTPRVFETLLFLVENAGETLSKGELLAAVWRDLVVEENNLAKNISCLRQLLGEKPGDHRYIVTIPGRGYCFVARVKCIHGSHWARHANRISGANSPAKDPVLRRKFWWWPFWRSVASLGRLSADAM